MMGETLAVLVVVYVMGVLCCLVIGFLQLADARGPHALNPDRDRRRGLRLVLGGFIIWPWLLAVACSELLYQALAAETEREQRGARQRAADLDAAIDGDAPQRGQQSTNLPWRPEVVKPKQRPANPWADQ